MAAKKGGLGKGLDSLIVNKNEGVVVANPEQHGAPVEVEIDKKKQMDMRKKKGRAAKQKRWEMKVWERMRKFALLRIFEFTL